MLNLNALKQTTAYHFPRAFAEESLKTGKQLLQTAGKSVLTAGSYPLDIYTTLRGREPLQPINVPGIGEVKTLARGAIERDVAGGRTNLSRILATSAALGEFAGGVLTATGLTHFGKSFFPKKTIIEGVPKMTTANLAEHFKYNAEMGLKAHGNYDLASRLMKIDFSGAKSVNDFDGIIRRVLGDSALKNPDIRNWLISMKQVANSL